LDQSAGRSAPSPEQLVLVAAAQPKALLSWADVSRLFREGVIHSLPKSLGSPADPGELQIRLLPTGAASSEMPAGTGSQRNGGR